MLHLSASAPLVGLVIRAVGAPALAGILGGNKVGKNSLAILLLHLQGQPELLEAGHAHLLLGAMRRVLCTPLDPGAAMWPYIEMS